MRMNWTILACALLCAALTTSAAAQLAPLTIVEQEALYTTEVRVYRVLTNISGESSQTMASVPGVFHLANLHFDGVNLVMKEDSLKWNGEDEPDHPSIRKIIANTEIRIFKPDLPYNLRIQDESPIQYFVPKDDGSFELKAHESKTGIAFAFTIVPGQREGTVVLRDFSFESVVVTGRKKIEGLTLDVGEPNVETQRIQGKVTARLGHWVAATYRVPSQGAIYAFFKVKAGG